MSRGKRAAGGPSIIDTIALRTRSSDVFDSVDRGRVVLIRRYGRMYRLLPAGVSPRTNGAPRGRNLSSPVHQRGWSWTFDPKRGGLRLAKPGKRRRRR